MKTLTTLVIAAAVTIFVFLIGKEINQQYKNLKEKIEVSIVIKQ